MEEKELKFYPSNKMFSFDNSSVTWGNRNLMWTGQNRQGYFIAYFYASSLQPDFLAGDGSRLNLKFEIKKGVKYTNIIDNTINVDDL